MAEQLDEESRVEQMLEEINAKLDKIVDLLDQLVTLTGKVAALGNI